MKTYDDELSSARWLEIYETGKKLGIKRHYEIKEGISADDWNNTVDYWRKELNLSGYTENEFFDETINGWQNKMGEQK